MPSPKIVLYFTPDVKQIGRIPLSDIKFDQTKGDRQKRGKYEISLAHPCFIEGEASSLKSSIKSTATLTFKSVCFGEKTKNIFKVTDYFEIWDDQGDPFYDFCYFRGVVRQTSSNYSGDQRRHTIILDNAAGWMLGDNSIYYLRQLIITQQNAPTQFFNPIKNRYGWLNPDGSDSAKFDALGVELVKKPSELLESLVNKIGNERVKLLKTDFYDNSDAIKPMEFSTGEEVDGNQLFIANRLSQMEGSILDILKMFEGRPFSEIFSIETSFASKLIWRNSRWRDKDDKLCMEDKAGTPYSIVNIFTDPKAKFSERADVPTNNKYQEDYVIEYNMSGILGEPINKTSDDVINAIFIYPSVAKTNVPTMVIDQTRFDQEGSKNILDLDSVIRHGYKPVTIDLPFIPGYMSPFDYNKSTKSERDQANTAHNVSRGEYLSEHTRFAASMYRNISDSGNGSTTIQNNRHIQVIDDFRIIRENKNTLGISEDEKLFVNVNKITWYLSANAPTTVIEWDRGFEKEILIGVDQGFTYA